MKLIFLLLGFITLALGALGAVLPFLPSVPFLMLSAFCFAKSSERLNQWFRSTKLYQENIEDLVEHRGMTKKAKARIMATVTALMAVGFLFMGNAPIGRIVLAVVWACHVLAFCFLIKTCETEGPDKRGYKDHDD